jgi:hypothetical protein
LERYYNKIFVASDSLVTSPSSFLWLPKSIRAKMVYSGFVTYPVSENEVKQTLKKVLSFRYTNFELSSVFIDLELSGRRSDPKAKITPKIKLIGNNTKETINISIAKVDVTKYSDIMINDTKANNDEED